MVLSNLFKKKGNKEDYIESTQEEASTLTDTDTNEELTTEFDNNTEELTLEQALIEISHNFIAEYHKNSEVLYKNLLILHPEAFRLYNTKNIRIYHVLFNKNYYTHNECLMFVYEENANMDFQSINLTDESYYEYDTPVFNKTTEEVFASVVSEVEFKDIIYSLQIFDARIRLAKKRELIGLDNDARFLLNNEARHFNEHSNYPQDYYAKNAARYAYSELDLVPIIEKVDNSDFSYQLDQAIAAYDNSLYLPACATLGVCLETICKLLLENNGVKIKDSDSTMLDRLSAKLKENGLINYKLKGRIDVCYKVRNLASHTSPGKIVKSDCHFILNTISEIVETNF